MEITLDDIQAYAKELKIELEDGIADQLLLGMSIEADHGSKLGEVVNITDDDGLMTFKIALAHLMELPDYYTRLTQMLEEARASEESEEDAPEETEESEVVTESSKWEAPKDAFKLPTPKLAEHIFDGVTTASQAMERLSSIPSDDADTKVMGKINRIRNLIKHHKFTESLQEKAKVKLDKGVYWFKVSCKDDKEMQKVKKQLTKAKSITVQSTHPPTNTIMVTVDNKTASQARTIVKLVVDKFNDTMLERKQRFTF